MKSNIKDSNLISVISNMIECNSSNNNTNKNQQNNRMNKLI